MPPEAIEQCAYCHENNPVTYYDVGERPDAALSARVPICETCYQTTSR